MQLLLIFTLFCVCSLFLHFSLAAEKCPRDESKIDPDRKCRKQCDSDKDCKGENKKCNCDNVCGMSCFNKNAECPSPLPLEGGNIIGDNYVYGAIIEYICNDGYIIRGKTKRSCRSDKTWAGEAPVCDPACSSPPSFGVAFSAVPGTGFPVKTKVNYKCRFGYNPIGNTESECKPDFTWSTPKLECVAINCGDPGTPTNGYLEGSDFSFGSWVTYRCDKGFVIDNVKRIRRHCSTTGLWSGEERTCGRMKCEQPRNPENGFVTISDRCPEFRSLVNYHCDAGYQLVGDSQGECNEEGNWGPIPKCSVDVNCNFDGISNALCGYTNEMGEWGRQFEQDNTLSQNPSYVLRALSTPAMLRSPLLISGDPHCFQFHYYIKEISSDDSLVITTMNGKNTAGRIYKAEKTPRWLNQQITINPIKMFGGIQFDIVQNDDGTEIDFEDFSLSRGDCNTNCPPGTCLNGGLCIDRIATFKCLCTRFFRGRNCKIEITCPPVTDIGFGEIHVSGDTAVLRPDTEVTFSCIKGYRMVNGPSQIICGDDGQWSTSRRPKCAEILCSQPQKLSGGSMSVVLSETGKMSIGSLVNFDCPIGTYLEGTHPAIVCGKNGEWSSERQGSCKKQELHFESMECPEGYRIIDTMCYREYKSRSTYFKATSTCASFGGNLFVLKSQEERKRLEKIVSPRAAYHLGLDNIGQKMLSWSTGDKFVKISSERFASTGIEPRKHITSQPRCGYFLNIGQTTTIATGSCLSRRNFVCQAFPQSIRPVIIDFGPENLIGIYRPVMGLRYMGCLVYKMEGPSDLSLFRKKNGWTIGKFGVKDTKPIVGEDLANTNAQTDLPQNIKDDWSFGSKVEQQGETILNLKIKIFDQWKPWSDWLPCPVTCGGGKQLRKRDCAQVGGQAGYCDCKGALIQTRDCNKKQCIKTRWGAWTKWSKCSKPCDGGVRSRRRTCIRDPEGLEICKGKGEQTVPCNEQVCHSETSEWLRSGDFEYKIIYDSRSATEAAEKCAEVNGRLALIYDNQIFNFLKRHVTQLHCSSQSAHLDWELWAINSMIKAIKRSGDTAEAEKTIDSNSAGECDVILHQCDTADNMPWITFDCNTTDIAGYICQRDWSPCNIQPCGSTGTCIEKDGQYKCECFNNFQGPKCQTEKRCNVEKQMRKYKVTFVNSKNAGQQTSIAKNKTIRLDCSEDGKGTADRQTFTCIGMNKWDSEEIPSIRCATICVLPKLKSKEIVAKHDDVVVPPGGIFPLDTLLTFECPDMMKLVGAGSAECKINGWDVELPTDCENALPCSKVPTPAHGRLTIRPVAKFQSKMLESGTKITVVCESNYVIIGNKEIICRKNGQWSKKLGNCSNKQGCPLVISKLSKQVTPMETGTFNDITEDTLFAPEQSVYLFCSRVGTMKTFSCGNDNIWQPDISSYCR